MTTPTSTTPRSRAWPAVVAGVATAAYYAVPDMTPSRTARAWLKTGCLALACTAAVPTSRAAVQDLRAQRDEIRAERAAAAAAEVTVTDGTRVVGDPALDDEPAPGTPSRRAQRLAAVVGGTVVLAGSAALTVAAERGVYAFSERRAARGVTYAHTRTGLVLGAVSAALALLPEPRRD